MKLIWELLLYEGINKDDRRVQHDSVMPMIHLVSLFLDMPSSKFNRIQYRYDTDVGGHYDYYSKYRW